MAYDDLKQLKKAKELPIVRSYYARDYEGVIRDGQQLIREGKENGFLYFYMGKSYQKLEKRKEAAACFEKGVLLKDWNSKFALGECLLDGYGVKKDPQRGIELIREVADGRYQAACLRLGECYETGYGVEKDLAKAFTYYYMLDEAHMTKKIEKKIDYILKVEGIDPKEVGWKQPEEKKSRLQIAKEVLLKPFRK